MKKMLEIDWCGDCTHVAHDNDYRVSVCERENKLIDVMSELTIPSWCSLPDADMFAAAGTAATALAEAGYDAVEVLRALPEILEDWRCKITMLDSVASRVVTKESHDLLRRIKVE